MEKYNIIKEKSYAFALRIIKLHRFLVYDKKEYIISKQLLRSGTSVGANIEEAIGASSIKDFLNKISIAYKETRETRYWLLLLYKSNYVNNLQHLSIKKDCNELIKIITKIQKTTKKRSIK